MTDKPLTQQQRAAILEALKGGKSAFKSGATERFNADKQRREAANGPTSSILGVDDVEGKYDAHRKLLTTLGVKKGEKLREITLDDLIAFKRNIEAVKKHYVAGITASQVIDLSLDDDRKRANQQIHAAIPTRYKGDTLHFMTNASAGSDVKQHYVVVRFLDLGAIATTPIPLMSAAKQVAEGRLAFDCDCGRHTYWYRYIATIGGFNAGRAETGFPPIRNPHLAGVACKHVLRVMHVLSLPLVAGRIKEMVKLARHSTKPMDKLPEHQLSAKEVKDMATAQAAKAHHKRNQIVKTEDNPAIQRKRAKEAAKLAPVMKSLVAEQRAKREQVILHGTIEDKRRLKAALQKEMATAVMNYQKSNDSQYLYSAEALQGYLDRLK